MLSRALPFFLIVALAWSQPAMSQSSRTSIPSGIGKTQSNSTLAMNGARSSVGGQKFGFHAHFEIRVAPGLVKPMEVRQYFNSEEHAVAGFLRVRNAMVDNAHLVSIVWVTPTDSQQGLGQ